MAWICAIRRKEGGKGEERLYYRDDEMVYPPVDDNKQFLRELFAVPNLRGISLRTIDKADLPKLGPLRTLRKVHVHYEASL